MVGWMNDRYYWADVLSELRQVLIRVEQTTRSKLRTDAGVWIEQLIDGHARVRREKRSPAWIRAAPARGRCRRRRWRRRTPSTGVMAWRTRPGAGAASGRSRTRRRQRTERLRRPGKTKGDTNEIATVTLTFRAVSLKRRSGQADADKGIAYAVLDELQSSPLVSIRPAGDQNRRR